MIKFSVGSFDVLRADDLDDLDEKIQKSKGENASCFGVGVFSDEYIEARGMGTPLKPLADRMAIASQLKGVDFVFPVNSQDQNEIISQINVAYKQYLEKKKEEEQAVKVPKKYKVGYAPGTYDLFHMGHLEHLMIASEQCETLIVGVKADSLVEGHKGKKTTIKEDERMDILRHFKFVGGVHKYYTRNPHVADEYIKMKTGRRVDAFFLGSDLRDDFDKYTDELNIIYTERKPEVMQTRSTSAYLKRLKDKPRQLGEGIRYTSPSGKSEIKPDDKISQTSMFEEDGKLKTFNGEELSIV